MSLIPWKPFNEMDRFWGDDEFFFPVMQRSGSPAMDIKEDEQSVIAEIELPGIDPDNIELTVENNLLTISGEQEEKKEHDTNGYIHREIKRGSFSRSARLPASVIDSQVEATYKDGILTVVMTKTSEAKPKQIEIKKM